MAVVKNLMVRAGFDASGMYKGVNKAQQSMNQFQRSINRSFGMIKTALFTLGVRKIIKDAKDVAVGYESSFNQISRTMGNSSKDFSKWVKEQSYNYGMAKDEAYKYGAVYSNLISGFSKGTSQTTEYTKNLLQASAVVASGTGRTMQDTMERIRSGMLGNTEAIEDLGINVNVAMLESTKAFQQFANGRSWQQLTFQEQQQIRYMAILEQANLKYGDSLANTTATRQLQFTAALRNCQLALGQAFLPIYNVILPALTSFVNALAKVLNVVATFTNTLFGKSGGKSSGVGAMADNISSAAGSADDLGTSLGGAGDAAKQTAKEVNRLMGGFDEINSLNSNADSSGAGGSGGAGGAGGAGGLGPIDLGMSEEPDISGVSKAALKLKAMFNDLTEFIKKNKEIILALVGGLTAGIATYFGGPKLAKAFTKFTKYFTGIPGMISSALGLINLPLLAVAAVIAAVAGALIYLWQTSEGFRDVVVEAWNKIKELVATVWTTTLKPIFDAIVVGLMMIWENGLKPLVRAFVDFVEQVAILLLNLWNNVLQPVFKWLFEVLGPPFAAIVGAVVLIVSGAITTIMAILQGILDFITWIIEMVNKLFNVDWKAVWQTCQNTVMDIWKSIQAFFKTTWDNIVNLASSTWKGIQQAWNSAGQWFKANVTTPISNFFSGMWDKIRNTASNTWDSILGLFAKGGKIFSGITGSIAEVFKTIVNSIISGINTVIAVPFNSINGILNRIRGISILGLTPFSGFWGYNPLPVPRIPYLAKGGVINSATLAMVGEAGKEVVMPLENNTQWISELASKVADRMPGGASEAGGDLVLMIDGSVIGKVALKQLRKMQRQGAISLMPT